VSRRRTHQTATHNSATDDTAKISVSMAWNAQNREAGW
jgi:hypothetical protein